MKLQTVAPPERGSLSIVYSCPECGYEMAMLTNAYETQVVQSLGVRIGPAEARLANIPEFVRPMAKTGIERFARENGAIEVDEKILDQAREFFGM